VNRLPLILALATVYLVWGSTYLAIRVAVLGMPPFLTAWTLAGSALIILSVGLVIQGGKRSTPPRTLPPRLARSRSA
jgi:drug/metabolite transporter (DMT)-like permease